MARGNGSLTEKQVTAWFDGLSFERQDSLMQELSASHGKLRADRIAKLRRELAALEGGAKTDRKTRGAASGKAKYRDPETGEEWSGRGRMARWLAAKVKAGEKAQRYLVK
jgi:DNA-binding protein H-NS